MTKEDYQLNLYTSHITGGTYGVFNLGVQRLYVGSWDDCEAYILRREKANRKAEREFAAKLRAWSKNNKNHRDAIRKKTNR